MGLWRSTCVKSTSTFRRKTAPRPWELSSSSSSSSSYPKHGQSCARVLPCPVASAICAWMGALNGAWAGQDLRAGR